MAKGHVIESLLLSCNLLNFVKGYTSLDVNNNTPEYVSSRITSPIPVTACPYLTYGPKCQQACHCRDGHSCLVDGFCPNGCHPRFTGQSCDITCPDGYFLRNQMCSGVCYCRIHNMCRIDDGTCLGGGCLDNRYGERCHEIQCQDGKYGENCEKTCHCKNNRPCGSDGYCADGCDNRYAGRECQKTCQNGYFVENDMCVGICGCRIESQCRLRDGVCMFGGCKLGRVGLSCQDCQHGKFGLNCSKVCHCKDDAHCEINGFCSDGCDVRYTGTDCQTTCPDELFLIGQFCTGKCQCADNQKCNVLDGSCPSGICPEKRTGPYCQECEEGYFGLDCESECHCKNKEPCDSKTGVCKNGCDVRYSGPFCQSTCPHGEYMVTGSCTGVCYCQDESHCHVTNGSCGRLGCAKGRSGPACQNCPPGSFGDDCDSKCHCFNDAVCNSDGTCDNGCDVHYFGIACQETCMQGLFAINSECVGTCHCRVTSLCRTADGICIQGGCVSPFSGDNCQDCVPGKFGKNCEKTCHCSSTNDCDKYGSCISGPCDLRYTGDKCQETCPVGYHLYRGECTGKCACAREDQCAVINGNCQDNICIGGRMGQDCKGCVTEHSFGDNCEHKCYCKELSDCLPPNAGFCTSGCVQGYSGSQCSMAKASADNSGKNNNGLSVPTIVGILLAISALLALAIGGFIYYRYRKHKNLLNQTGSDQTFSEYDDENSQESFNDPQNKLEFAGQPSTVFHQPYGSYYAYNDLPRNPRDRRIRGRLNNMRSQFFNPNQCDNTYGQIGPIAPGGVSPYYYNKPSALVRPRITAARPRTLSPLQRRPFPSTGPCFPSDRISTVSRPYNALRHPQNAIQSRYQGFNDHLGISHRLGEITNQPVPQYPYTYRPVATKPLSEMLHETTQALRDAVREGHLENEEHLAHVAHRQSHLNINPATRPCFCSDKFVHRENCDHARSTPRHGCTHIDPLPETTLVPPSSHITHTPLGIGKIRDSNCIRNRQYTL